MTETPKAKSDKRKTAKASIKKSAKASIKKTAKANGNKPAIASDSKPEAKSGGRVVKNTNDIKTSREKSPLTWMAVAFALVGLAVLTYATSFKLDEASAPDPKTVSAKFKTTSSIGGPFSLVDQEGNAVTDMDFRGQYMLIYFGYTYCPDVCPTSLTDISDALERLGDLADKVTPILITIDPGRDTPEHLKEYASFFHPSLRALTGTREQIASVAKAYRVYFNKAKREDSTAEDYFMDHSSAIYLMGPDGTFRAHFSHGTDPKIMAQRLREIIS